MMCFYIILWLICVELKAQLSCFAV